MKYSKHPLTIIAYQPNAGNSTPVNFGSLGTLSSTDWLMRDYGGHLTTKDNSSFVSEFIMVADGTPLAGSLST